MQDGRTGSRDAGATGLLGGQRIEAGLGNSLGNILLGGRATGNGLEDLDGSISSRANSGGRLASDLQGQQAGIRVSQVAGDHLGAVDASRGLGQQGEARGPLNVRLATEQSSQDLNGSVGGVQAAGREGNDDSVARGGLDAVLAAKVLGGGAGEGAAGVGGLLEELVNPLAQGNLGSAIGNQGKVGAGVGGAGELGDTGVAQVAAEGRGRRGVQGLTQAGVEGNGVDSIQGGGQVVG